MLDLEKLYEQYNGEYLKFDRVESPLHLRPDVCAFLMLDKIVPPVKNRLGGFNDMVTSAEHDEIWLNVDTKEFAKTATEEQFRDLIRCGVRYVGDVESFAMFV